jgi:hypothetical protein
VKGVAEKWSMVITNEVPKKQQFLQLLISYSSIINRLKIYEL